jgi:type IV secretory pathway VirB2 component (pilin)
MPNLTAEGLVVWVLGLLLPLAVEVLKRMNARISGNLAFVIAVASSIILSVLAILLTNGFKFTSLADAVASISLMFAISQVAYKLVYSTFMQLVAQPKPATA